MDTDNGLAVSLWRCSCGIRVKALVTALETTNPQEITVACPRCGNERMIDGVRLVSVCEQKDVLGIVLVTNP